MTVLRLLLYVACVCVSAVRTQEADCWNPDFTVGVCVRIEECPSLYALVFIRRKTTQQAALLKQSKCGFEENEQDSTVHQKVCCIDDSVVKFTSSSSKGSTSQACGHAVGPNASTRSEAALDAHPWLALIEYKRKTTSTFEPGCTGTIISTNMVLTAAQCLDYSKLLNVYSGPPISVRVGEHDMSTKRDCSFKPFAETCKETVQRIPIVKFLIPKTYSSDGVFASNDIGLIKLATDITFTDSVKAICLPNRGVMNNLRDGTALSTAGWGVYMDDVKSPVKMEVQINFVDKTKCKLQYDYIDNSLVMDATTICAGNVCEDQNYQNLGAPLMMYQSGTNTWHIVGVSTLLLNYCGSEQMSGLFTNIHSYEAWINEQVDKNNKQKPN